MSPSTRIQAVSHFDQREKVHSHFESKVRFNLQDEAWPDSVLRLKQTHSDIIHTVRDDDLGVTDPLCEGDAIICRNLSTKIAVVTADCLPVVITNRDHTLGAVIHAGWRGLTKGIINKTLKKISQFSSLDELQFALGPAISSKNYEVGEDVIEALRSKELSLEPEQVAASISDRGNRKWSFDLKIAALFDLVNHGAPAKNIFNLDSCTYEHPDLWASYRRNGKGAGRNLSWVQVERH